MAEEIRLDVVTTAHSRGLSDAARELKGLRTEADKTGTSFHRTSDESFNLDRAIHDARTEVHRLNEEFKRSGDHSLFRDMRRARSELNDLLRVAGRGGGAGGGVVSGMFDLGGAGIRPVHALIGALVAAVAAAAPALGAMIAGAVTGAVGLGGIVGGIFAAARSPAVRQAASQFASNISNAFFQMGDEFVEPLVGALQTLQEGFSSLHLEDAFEKVAPYVDDLAMGLAGFGKNFMVGFSKALDAAGPALELLGRELPTVGDALGYMFSKMAESKGTLQGLLFFLGVLEATFKGVGNVVGWLSDQFYNFNAFMRDTTAFLAGMFKAVAPGATFLQDAFLRVSNTISNFIGAAEVDRQVLVGLGREHMNLAGAAQATADAVNKLNDALLEEQNKMLAASNATLAYEADLIRLNEQVKEHGTSLKRNTEEGNANRQMINQTIGDLQRELQASIDAANGDSKKIDAAKKKYNDQIANLQRLLEKLGFEKAEIARIIEAYKNIPRQVTTKIIQDYQTRGVPAGEHSGVRIGETRGRAAGGPVWPGDWRVGEGGPERLRINADGTGYVYPEAGSGGRGGGARPVNITVVGSEDDQRLLDRVVREVRRRGGTLAVIGIK